MSLLPVIFFAFLLPSLSSLIYGVKDLERMATWSIACRVSLSQFHSCYKSTQKKKKNPYLYQDISFLILSFLSHLNFTYSTVFSLFDGMTERLVFGGWEWNGAYMNWKFSALTYRLASSMLFYYTTNTKAQNNPKTLRYWVDMYQWIDGVLVMGYRKRQFINGACLVRGHVVLKLKSW